MNLPAGVSWRPCLSLPHQGPQEGTMDGKSPYPYDIRAIDQSKIKARVSPAAFEKFCLIETLLRMPEVTRLYNEEREEFDRYWRYYHGIFGYNPVKGSHHALICRRDRDLEQKLLQLGYIDVDLGIIDLGNIFKLAPETVFRHGDIDLVGPTFGGEAECNTFLQSNDPRYLHLRLDTTRPPAAIWEAIKPLLTARYKISIAGRRRSTSKAIPKSEIKTFLEYFRCFDLRRSGLKVREIADIVARERDDSKGAADEYAKQALRRSRKKITSARILIRRERHFPLLGTAQ
jgi:hypothetical protein